MQINNNSYNVNFGSKLLYSAILKQKCVHGGLRNKRVYISELTLDDSQYIEGLLKIWQDTPFGIPIIADFMRELHNIPQKIGKVKRYFLLETAGSTMPKSTRAMAVARIFPDQIFVPMLQALTPHNEKGAIKGAGSTMLYAVTKLANQKRKKLISLNPTREAEGFYKKLGFDPVPPDEFSYRLNRNCFSTLTETLEKKYSIKPIDG